MYRYKVERNPEGTWAVIELWAGGVVRSPYLSRQQAIAREQEIARYFQFDDVLELVET